ncbi:MAG: hypothetical protein K9H49_04630 [Bacteroidales bacterium]|nr:hypothetical protein [Bacteroidales bacterium]MCF8389101.1 hypothetical protein [Bacteroidales bacterium]
MKKKYLISLLLTIFILSFSLPSCKKDDNFHSISNVERAIHNKINEYRVSKGLNPLVEQFLYFEEARKISNKLADGTYEYGDPEIQSAIDDFSVLLGGTSNGHVIMTSNIENADSIVNAMLNVPSVVVLVESEFTQSGVGVSKSIEGLYHICHVFVNIPN